MFLLLLFFLFFLFFVVVDFVDVVVDDDDGGVVICRQKQNKNLALIFVVNNTMCNAQIQVYAPGPEFKSKTCIWQQRQVALKGSLSQTFLSCNQSFSLVLVG